jgi:hypothetical protein
MAGILGDIHPALRSVWDLGAPHVLGWATAAAMALSVVVMIVTQFA